MDRRLAAALQDCLEQLGGGSDLESVLGRHPAHGEALRSLLAAAQSARDLGRGPLPANAMTIGRARLLKKAAELRKSRRGTPVLTPALRVGFAAVLIVAFLVLAGGGLVTASADALPGDALYGVKRTAERLRLDLTFDAGQQTALEDEFHQRRIQETEALLSGGRVEQVEFSGVVSGQTADGWTVSGIRVIVSAQTEMEGEIRIGSLVEVRGLTQADDSVLAQRIRAESAEDGGASSGAGNGGEPATSESGNQESGNDQADSTQTAGDSGDEGEGDSQSSSGESTSDGPDEPAETTEPTRTPKPSKTPEPTRTAEPTRTEAEDD